jgi:hypothetical protein
MGAPGLGGDFSGDALGWDFSGSLHYLALLCLKGLRHICISVRVSARTSICVAMLARQRWDQPSRAPLLWVACALGRSWLSSEQCVRCLAFQFGHARFLETKKFGGGVVVRLNTFLLFIFIMLVWFMGFILSSLFL